MNNKRKVSVITVVFNDVKNIEKTINNVLKQTYNNLEYIVVDGCSTDGTLEKIKKFESKLIWISEKDKGIYDAMQKGVKLATGEWIIFRNSGDYFISKDTIQNVFNRYIDNGEDFIICNTRYFNKYGYKDFTPSILNKHYFENMPVGHPSTFIRRVTQLKYPFHLEYKNSADYCFFIEAFENGAKYKYIDLLVGLFDAETGTTAESFDISFQNNIDILKKFHAPQKYIDKIQKEYKTYLFKKKFKGNIFYKLYYIYNLRRNGWKFQKISHTLSNI